MIPTHDTAVANRPAYLFLLLVIGLHFTIGSVLQLANPAFGVSFGELFFFAALAVLFARAQNYRAIDFLALRLPPTRTLVAAIVAAIAGFFFAGGINAVNRWIVGPEIAAQYDITGLFDVRSPFEGVLLVLGVAVLAPLGEELVFRGYLLRVLDARYGTVRAVLVTSLLFAAIHLNPASILALFALGLVFALLRVWTGSIWPAVIAHAVQNGTSSALVLLGVAEDSPDEMEIGSALLLLAITTPALWLALRHLRGMPRADDAPPAPIDPEAGHNFDLQRVVKPVLGLFVVAAAAVVALLAIDGEAVRERIERAAGRDEVPVAPPSPDAETPELPGIDATGR